MTETERACGWRSRDGIYLVSDAGIWYDCDRPAKDLIIKSCECCGHTHKFSQSFAEFNPKKYLGTHLKGSGCTDLDTCKLCKPPSQIALLMYVGDSFYPTAKDFLKEVFEMGMSKKIANLPKSFVMGESLVYLVKANHFTDIELGFHPKKIIHPDQIFACIRPTRVEYVIGHRDAENEEYVEWLKTKGLTPVIVNQDDPKHNPKGNAKLKKFAVEKMKKEKAEQVKRDRKMLVRINKIQEGELNPSDLNDLEKEFYNKLMKEESSKFRPLNEYFDDMEGGKRIKKVKP